MILRVYICLSGQNFDILRIKMSPLKYKLLASVAYRVPFSHGSLLLKSCEFPSVMDGGEDLPHENQQQTDSHNCSYDTQNDA